MIAVPRPGPRIRTHVVCQPSDRAEPGAWAAGSRVAVFHAAPDIGHAAAAVQCQHLQSRAAGIVVAVAHG